MRRISMARLKRGFTLVELMVSLVAGLFVTLAVVGLARAATRTFFEAARISSAESAVRTASERLRQDLSRAGYMSTGNIKLARDGVLPVPIPLAHRIAVRDPSQAAGAATGSRYTTFNDLQGIRIIVGGSGSFASPLLPGAGTPVLSGNNGLNPDALIVSGNFTTDDAYSGKLRPNGACPGGQQVELRGDGDAAVNRMIGTSGTPNPNALANLQAAFTPVTGFSYAARVVDARGCQHYTIVCSVTVPIAGTAMIHLQGDAGGNPPVLPQASSNCGGNVDEPVTVSPLQRRAWFIGPNVDPQLDADPSIEPIAYKFNLYRQMLDAADIPVPIPATQQIVAEYAVDLKFGITAINELNAMKIFDMDGDPGGGAGDVDTWTKPASTTQPTLKEGPQRVRSVRFRVATRAPIADRDNGLLVPPGAPYLTRYCVGGVAAASCTKFARMRTIVTEVALLNQFGMTY
jgi:type II secretory pathway pseudopilin PulG